MKDVKLQKADRPLTREEALGVLICTAVGVRCEADKLLIAQENASPELKTKALDAVAELHGVAASLDRAVDTYLRAYARG